MADTADKRVQNRFLFTAPYISNYTKMAAVFRNYVIICTQNDVIENALHIIAIISLAGQPLLTQKARKEGLARETTR